MKTCTNCLILKDQSHFSKKLNICKSCIVQKSRDYQRTLWGLVVKIYNNQLMITKRNGRNPPNYSKESLYEWMLQNNYGVLHSNWVASNYSKWLSPSVGRLDNTKSYTLNNIQLGTWKENLNNQKAQNISGIYISKRAKPIAQLTLDGVEIARYPSIGCATRALGLKRGSTNIANIANGKYISAYGYKWAWC